MRIETADMHDNERYGNLFTTLAKLAENEFIMLFRIAFLRND